MIDESILSRGEQLSLALRSLYSRHGYRPYRMSKFEDYDLYGKNKDFLISDRVITFTDGDGRLKALKPDVTLSIIKNHTDGETDKLYYHENVYRVSKGMSTFKEIMQTGVECIGGVDSEQVGEVLRLAAESLALFGGSFVLDVSSLDILDAAMNAVTDSRSLQDSLARCVGEKNAHGVLSICEENGIDPSLAEPLIALMNLCGSPDRVLEPLGELSEKLGCMSAFRELKEAIADCGAEAAHIRLDFSVIGDRSYYNGAVFKGFLSGVPDSVLSGGRYDKLMKRMKRKSKAVGFAVYLDKLERVEDDRFSVIPQDGMLNVALPKGRLGEKVYAMFAKAGYECPSILEPNRKLIFENPKAGVRYFWVKPSDVAIYVERGAADIGVAGKDILLEYEPDVYELLDLGIGKCRMAVAAPVGFEDRDDSDTALRVATKFSRIAAAHYAKKGRDIDIVHLNGSIEIAPILGLTDVIVDIVETGATLKENHLEVVETIVPISARLISNKSSYQFKRGMIERLKQELQHD